MKNVNLIQRDSFVKWYKDMQQNDPLWNKDKRFFFEVIEIVDKVNSLYGEDEDVHKLKKKLFQTIIEYTTIKKSKLNGSKIESN